MSTRLHRNLFLNSEWITELFGSEKNYNKPQWVRNLGGNWGKISDGLPMKAKVSVSQSDCFAVLLCKLISEQNQFFIQIIFSPSLAKIDPKIG